MKGDLNIYYDDEGDYLELQIGSPRQGYFEELQNGVFERKDMKTNEVIGIAVFNFKKRTEKLQDVALHLPFKVELHAQ